MNSDEKDMEITLPLLQTIDEQHDISQRKLAQHLGVALGLTNSFVKHCIKKGLIKVEQIPANRYLYYLTPQGFAEKSRLAAKYLSNSFNFYRDASSSCRRCYQHCEAEGWNQVYLYGAAELTEIAIIQALRENIEILGICAPEFKGERFLAKKVHKELAQIPKQSVIIVTQLGAVETSQPALLTLTSAERILVPDILR